VKKSEAKIPLDCPFKHALICMYVLSNILWKKKEQCKRSIQRWIYQSMSGAEAGWQACASLWSPGQRTGFLSYCSLSRVQCSHYLIRGGKLFGWFSIGCRITWGSFSYTTGSGGEHCIFIRGNCAGYSTGSGRGTVYVPKCTDRARSRAIYLYLIPEGIVHCIVRAQAEASLLYQRVQ
jgi:hypothetical protein